MSAATVDLSIGPEQNLTRYLQEIRKFPMLAPEEEYELSIRYRDQGDMAAAHKMVTSHLRLVAKIAMGYRGYGLPIGEVISEGNVGLMQSVKRFDPERGFRLATYAMWWIRASIQEYILRSWSLVKLGTTSAQKKLFFNLRKAKAKVGALEEGDLRPENVAKIAHDLSVSEDEVIAMNRRLAGSDASLNATVGSEDGGAQWQDWLEDEDSDQAGAYAEKDELDTRRALLAQAMSVLNDREKDVLIQRRLADEPKTLEDLSESYGVSRERIRQIEVRAFEKLQAKMRELAKGKGRAVPAYARAEIGTEPLKAPRRGLRKLRPPDPRSAAFRLLRRPQDCRRRVMKMTETFLKPMHPEGWKFVPVFAAVTLVLFLIWQPLGWIGLGLTVWCYYFFRDPKRAVPQNRGLLVSPADGVVSLIGPAVPPPELGLGPQPLLRVSVFMSVFNCHVNRAPIAGEVTAVAYRPGKFLNASLDKASEDN